MRRVGRACLKAAGARLCSAETSEKAGMPFIPFEWSDDKEQDWIAQHGAMHSAVTEVTKEKVAELFDQRTMEDKLLENMVMLDVRGRSEVLHTTRLDVDVDQCYVMPYDEIADAFDNLSAAQFYQKYIFPKPRSSDQVILYGKDKHDVRPFKAARLLQEKYSFGSVVVYAGGFTDYRGTEYDEWVELQKKKLASLRSQAIAERARLEERRRDELERYRRERAGQRA